MCGSCRFIEPADAPAGTLHLTAAQLAISAPGELERNPARILRMPSGLHWTDVSLPHAVPRALVPQDGRQDYRRMESFTIWYRMEIPAAEVTPQVTALYLPRWHTFGYLTIYADQELVYSSKEEGIFGSFNDPLLVHLPSDTIGTARPLLLVVRMDSVRQFGGAFSTVWLGPVAKLRSMYDTRRLLQNGVPRITSAIFLVLGLFALGIWWRRRHEMTQLLFFALSVLFYVRSLHYYIDEVWIPGAWFSWITVNSIGWLDVVTYFFAFRLYRQKHPRFERFLVGAMVVASAVTLPLGIVHNNLAVFSPLAYLIFTGISFSVAILLSKVAWRLRQLECVVLAGTLWLNIGLGVHDWMLQNWHTDIESIYLLPVGVVALVAMFLLTILRRYLGALSANERSGALLEARLADRERELHASYDRLREVEQAQLLSQERQRLMREMHDGLGSALMSSLIAVERGQMQSADVVQVLRECVDDLKLTIDSLEPVGDDLLLLLATLRFRLEGRLQAAGLRLVWDVDTLPSLAWLNPALSLHILRIVQEILTNVLKHARASTLRIAARHDDDFVTIEVEDDGIGFDTTGPSSGRGLSHLRQRAAALGARLEIDSRPGATRV
ncbi:MAG TPA: sensor histidine kinase, partial [Steroidobacteraceae bacterium]|nr:sensor histidine kinase [Steroidobacteraceae bacterium]